MRRCVVIDEHTLGVVLTAGADPQVQILRALVRKGAPWRDHLAGVTVLSPLQKARDATREDFAEFNVCHRGHLPEGEA